MQSVKNKILNLIAKGCIKLLTIDKVRVWVIANILRHADLDAIILEMKKAEDKAKEKAE